MTERRPTVSLIKQEKKASLPKASEVFSARNRGYVVVRNSDYVKAVASGDMEAMRATAPTFDARFNPPTDGSSEKDSK